MKRFALLAVMGLGLASSAFAAQSDAAMIDRIKAVGSVCVQGKPCDVKLPVVAAAPADPNAKPRSGEEVFKAVCTNCHTAGVMNAPKVGTADWAPRKAKGKPMLYDHALHGFNMMPARGGCSDCSDPEIQAAVDFMTK